MVNPARWSRIGEVRMSSLCVGPHGIELRLEHRVCRAAVLDQAAFDPRQPGVAGSRSGFVGHDDVIVVNVGHGPSLVGVDPLRQVAEGQRLEVEHQVATDHRVVEAGQEEEAGCLHGPAGEDDGVGRLGVSLALGVDPLHTGGPAALATGCATRRSRAAARPDRSGGPAAAAPPGHPWRGWGSRNRRRTRSCCRPAGRRRGPSCIRWAPHRGGSRAARRLPR